MRILLVILQYPPDVNSTGLLMDRLCRQLVDEGHEVSVITSFPHYEDFEVTEEYRGRWLERETRDGIDILRLNVYTGGEKRVPIHRLLNYLSFNVQATVAGAFSRRKFDMVLCTNGSFFTGVTGWLIGLLKRAPVVYNVQDLYPEVPVNAGQIQNPVLIRALRAIESFMYARADHVTVITPSFRDNLLEKGVPDDRVSVIPNFVDVDFIRPLPRDNEWSHRHGLVDRVVVSHAGNVGFAYDLGTMLDAAERLQDREEIVFLIVGDGVAKADLQAEARTRDLSNVRFLPFQPLEELPLLRAASDIQVSLYRRGSGHNSMPSKVYEIMASGRPLLASADPGTDVRRFVEESGVGITVDPEEPRQLTRAVERLADDEELRRELGRKGRDRVVSAYSQQAVASRYLRLLERLTAV